MPHYRSLGISKNTRLISLQDANQDQAIIEAAIQLVRGASRGWWISTPAGNPEAIQRKFDLFYNIFFMLCWFISPISLSKPQSR
jgi:hypothetical protein